MLAFFRSRSAHLFSMRTNGLDLKPRSRPERYWLSRHRALCRGLFFATVPGGFLALFLRLVDPREIRRLRARPDQGPSCLINETITYSLNRGCGFIKRRLRTV
jgi:hypothetical protein